MALRIFFLFGAPAAWGISGPDSIHLSGDRQDNLSDVFAAFHEFVGFVGIFEGETGRDEGFDLSAFDQRPDSGAQVFCDVCFGRCGPGAEGGSGDGQSFEQYWQHIDFNA